MPHPAVQPEERPAVAVEVVVQLHPVHVQDHHGDYRQLRAGRAACAKRTV
jgi:hypothetical protein